MFVLCFLFSGSLNDFGVILHDFLQEKMMVFGLQKIHIVKIMVQNCLNTTLFLKNILALCLSVFIIVIIFFNMSHFFFNSIATNYFHDWHHKFFFKIMTTNKSPNILFCKIFFCQFITKLFKIILVVDFLI